MKNYQEFMDYVKENVADYLPEKFEQADITVHQMVKNNDVMLDGLNIHDPDSNLSPNIYLNPLYEQYENGRDLDEIVAEVADTYVENMGSALTRDFQLNVDDIRNFEAVKDNIFPKLVNLEKNSSPSGTCTIYTEGRSCSHLSYQDDRGFKDSWLFDDHGCNAERVRGE